MPTCYSAYNDAELLSLLAKEDDKAFTEIYNRYWDKLLYVAVLKCRNLEVAEEIVQDIFLDIWKRRAELTITDELEAYLAVSVKYRVINAQARMKKALEYQHFITGTIQPSNSTEEWLSFQELKTQLAQLVSKLPEKCRITYQLSREEGLTQREIASHLKVSQKAVEANLTRALRILRLNLRSFLSVFPLWAPLLPFLF